MLGYLYKLLLALLLACQIFGGGLWRTDAWTLDLMGNWVGGSASGTTGPPAGRITEGNINEPGSPWSRELTQLVNERNEVSSFLESAGGTSGSRVAAQDAAGNLIYDGRYFYQYDAWNRLIQVNLASEDPSDFTPVPVPGHPNLSVGPMVKEYAYDGLGRLVRTLSPYPEPGASGGLTRSERFYYDGVRRIQELLGNPVASLTYAQGSQDPALQDLGEEHGGDGQDGDGAPLPFEDGQQEGGLAPLPFLEREYVWGVHGTDELLVQYDRQRVALWAIVDDGGDVVAACDLGGLGGDARVAAQFTFDAYGDVLTADHIYAHAHLRCGHKGLFVDRLDVGVVTSGGVEQPRLIPSAHTIIHNRNRTYVPQMGRFLQQDPNATAAVLMESAASHGRGMPALVAAFDIEQRYGDGGNLYEYLGSSPWGRSDPLGLSWDPFDMVDDYLAEDAGNKAAFMQEIMQGFNATAHVVFQVAQLHPGVAVATLGFKLLTGQAMLTDLLSALPAVGRARDLIGHAFGNYWKGRSTMRAARKAGALADDVYELHHIIPEFMTGWTSGRAVILTRVQHQRYHRILDDVLRENRLPTQNQGKEAWEFWIRNNPGGGDRARAALAESVARFKSDTGIDMMRDLLEEMAKQEWLMGL